MKSLISIILLASSLIHSQTELQNIGLKNQSITSLKIWYGIIAVGTDNNGVYWSQFELPDSFEWKHIDLPGKNIRTVYPHKSGPIGWAIGAGIRPENGDTNFVYCSYMGDAPKSISSGFDKNLTYEISKLDGFPDPTICGETFAAGGRVLYRRFFTDTVWHPVYDLTIEGNFATINARLNYPTIIAGGGEGFANHLLIRSFDKGDSWDDISPLIYVRSVDFTDDSAKVIFVTDNFKILRSNDYGKTWNEVYSNPENLIIRKLRYLPDENLIFAIANTAWDSGPSFIFYSDIKTNEWNKLPFDLNNTIVDIDYGPDNWIYIATIDSGIYKFRNYIVNIENDNSSIPDKLSLLQNYPNPFNPTTTIEYIIPPVVKENFPSLQNVKIIVYDILGEKVATLVNETQSPGKYQIVFDASNLTSGIYYYSLLIDNNTQTRKMILLK